MDQIHELHGVNSRQSVLGPTATFSRGISIIKRMRSTLALEIKESKGFLSRQPSYILGGRLLFDKRPSFCGHGGKEHVVVGRVCLA